MKTNDDCDILHLMDSLFRHSGRQTPKPYDYVQQCVLRISSSTATQFLQIFQVVAPRIKKMLFPQSCEINFCKDFEVVCTLCRDRKSSL
jgi:hypothetical protein